VTGYGRPSKAVEADLRAAAVEIADITESVIARLPERRQPPRTLPPLRRPEVRERLGLEPFPA
jgi:hypothetical protein